jgi:hypothetical protein
MHIRTWWRDLGLATFVVVAASLAQLAGQAPARRFVAVDVVGNLSPGHPPGHHWQVGQPPPAGLGSLALGAGGNILFASSVGIGMPMFGEFASMPNNTSGLGGVTRFNPVGGADEIRWPSHAVEGTCWSGGGTCQYVADATTCSIYERNPQSGSIQRVVGTGQCALFNNASPPIVSGSNRLEAAFSAFTALGFTPAEGLVFGACAISRTAVYRIAPGLDGIEYLAGTGFQGAGASGPATATAIGCPTGPIVPALAPGGNETEVSGIAFAVQQAHVVLRVSGGMLDRLAGTVNTPGFDGDGQPATAGRLNAPGCVARHKTVYEICDSGNFRVRRVDNLTGIMTTAAGNGQSSPTPAGGLALNSSAGQVAALAFDAAGNRYTLDGASTQVGVYAAATSIYSVVFPPLFEVVFGPDNRPGNETPLYGAAGIARIDGPSGLEGLLVSDTFSLRVRVWNPTTNRVTTFAGGGPFPGNSSVPAPEGVPATESFLIYPTDVVRAPDGVTYIAEWLGCRIRKVDAAGIITTAVGNGSCTSTGDGGPASNASVSLPYGLALATDGRLFWSEGGSGTIRQRSTNGTVSRVAGNGTPGFSGDGGPAIDAQLSAFSDIELSADARFLFISDYANHAIRAVDFSLNPARIATIAGTGRQPGDSGDGGPANQAKLRFTEGVSLSGNRLAIADQDNHRIRVVTFPPNASSLQELGSGIITTVFGTGVPGRIGRGVSEASTARVNLPFALAPLAGHERGWFYTEQGGYTLGKLVELGAPNAPSAFSVNVSANSVVMAWQPPDAGAPATGYRVLGRLTAGGPVVGQLDTTEPSVTVDAPNGTYVLSVQASNGFGDGPESATRTITIPQPYIASGPPRNLSSAVAGSTVTLRWMPPAGGGPPTQYVVAPSMTPGGPPITLIPIGAILDAAAEPPLAQVTSFSATGVPPGTYYVRLYASNPGNTGLSAPSNEVTVVVAPPNTPVLNTPMVNGRTVTLTWVPAAGPVATSYTLTASLSPSGPAVASTSTVTTALTVTNVTPGSYFVRVSAVNDLGASAPSNEVTVVVR